MSELETEERPTLADLMTTHGITATVEYGAPERNDDWQADGWTVTFHRKGDGRKRLTVPFYMGSGHHGAEPGAAEVMGCLLSDADCYENAQDIDDFANEFGYDKPSAAIKAYKGCERIGKRLDRFLGSLFETFRNAERP